MNNSHEQLAELLHGGTQSVAHARTRTMASGETQKVLRKRYGLSHITKRLYDRFHPEGKRKVVGCVGNLLLEQDAPTQEQAAHSAEGDR